MNKEEVIKKLENIKKIYFPIFLEEKVKLEFLIDGLNFKLNCLEHSIKDLENLIKEEI